MVVGDIETSSAHANLAKDTAGQRQNETQRKTIARREQRRKYQFGIAGQIVVL